MLKKMWLYRASTAVISVAALVVGLSTGGLLVEVPQCGAERAGEVVVPYGPHHNAFAHSFVTGGRLVANPELTEKTPCIEELHRALPPARRRLQDETITLSVISHECYQPTQSLMKSHACERGYNVTKTQSTEWEKLILSNCSTTYLINGTIDLTVGTTTQGCVSIPKPAELYSTICYAPASRGAEICIQLCLLAKPERTSDQCISFGVATLPELTAP